MVCSIEGGCCWGKKGPLLTKMRSSHFELLVKKKFWSSNNSFLDACFNFTCPSFCPFSFSWGMKAFGGRISSSSPCAERPFRYPWLSRCRPHPRRTCGCPPFIHPWTYDHLKTQHRGFKNLKKKWAEIWHAGCRHLDHKIHDIALIMIGILVLP